MTPVIVGAALALLALDAAPANTPSNTVTVTGDKAAASAAANNSALDPDKMICKSETLTGSRFSKRVCMTRADWTEQQRRTEEFERKLGQTTVAPPSGGMSGH